VRAARSLGSVPSLRTRSACGLGEGRWTSSGRHSLSLLVAQDFLRLGVGMLLFARGDLADITWPLAPFYLALALLVTRVWHPLPQAAGDRLCPPPAR
jgi:hypothetical protein